MENDGIIIRDMTEAEARQSVVDVNKQGEELRRMLWDTYERNAHLALGYDSWRAMAGAEFKMGQTAAYYTLNAARVERGIANLPDTEPTFSQLCKDLPESVFRPLMGVDDPLEQRVILQLAWSVAKGVKSGVPTQALIEEAKGVVADIKLTEGGVDIGDGQWTAAEESVRANWTARQAAHIKRKMGEEPPPAQKDDQQQLMDMLIRHASVRIVSTNGRNVTLMLELDKDAKTASKLWREAAQGLFIDLYRDKE